MDIYDVRRSLAETASAYRLDAGALVRSVDGREVQRISLSDVRKVLLAYQPVNLSARWVCSVEGPHGRVWLPSVSYVSFGRIIDQRVAFRGFVEALHRAIAAEPAAVRIKFVQGGGWAPVTALVMVVVLIIMSILLLMGALGSMVGGRGLLSATWAIFPLLIVAYAARMAWPLWRKNRRRVYTPSALPADFATG